MADAISSAFAFKVLGVIYLTIRENVKKESGLYSSQFLITKDHTGSLLKISFLGLRSRNSDSKDLESSHDYIYINNLHICI